MPRLTKAQQLEAAKKLEIKVEKKLQTLRLGVKDKENLKRFLTTGMNKSTTTQGRARATKIMNKLNVAFKEVNVDLIAGDMRTKQVRNYFKDLKRLDKKMYNLATESRKELLGMNKGKVYSKRTREYTTYIREADIEKTLEKNEAIFIKNKLDIINEKISNKVRGDLLRLVNAQRVEVVNQIINPGSLKVQLNSWLRSMRDDADFYEENRDLIVEYNAHRVKTKKTGYQSKKASEVKMRLKRKWNYYEMKKHAATVDENGMPLTK